MRQQPVRFSPAARPAVADGHRPARLVAEPGGGAGGELARLLLRPLGRPTASGSKFFATVELQNLRSDTCWLARASDAMVNHWRNKNAGRRSKGGELVGAGA